MEHIFLIGYSVCVNLRHMYRWQWTTPANQCIPSALVGESMSLMTYNLDTRGLNPHFLTHKPRYSVSVCLKNYLYAFTFNNALASLCNTLYRSFWCYDKSFLVMTSTFYMYTYTISNPSNILDIFSWKILDNSTNIFGSKR